jgi:hypothetical protein
MRRGPVLCVAACEGTFGFHIKRLELDCTTPLYTSFRSTLPPLPELACWGVLTHKAERRCGGCSLHRTSPVACVALVSVRILSTAFRLSLMHNAVLMSVPHFHYWSVGNKWGADE